MKRARSVPPPTPQITVEANLDDEEQHRKSNMAHFRQIRGVKTKDTKHMIAQELIYLTTYMA
jgi:hypothetical protein